MGELGDHSSLWGRVKIEMLLVIFRGQVKETLVCLTWDQLWLEVGVCASAV